MTAILRTATTADGQQIAGIYAPSVASAATSFEMHPPTGAEMARRVADSLVTHPWLVADRSGVLLGYARAGRFRDRAAYDWSVEMSVYISADAHRSGIGRALYTAMFEILVLQGYYVAYAGATLPNAASVGLHESLGFTLIGIFAEAARGGSRYSGVRVLARGRRPGAQDLTICRLGLARIETVPVRCCDG